jgi:hypothetical protein
VQAPRRGFGVGHPLHPILTDVPIGVWTSSILLDWTGGKANQSASDRLILIGLLAAGATAASGWSDWANAEGEHAGVRRSGLVHAAANTTAVAPMLGSYSARKRGAGARQAAFARRLGRARRGRLAGRTSDLHARRRGHNERTTGSETAARGHLARLSHAPSRRRTQTKRDPAGFCLLTNDGPRRRLRRRRFSLLLGLDPGPERKRPARRAEEGGPRSHTHADD